MTFTYLHILRFLAAILVVFHHFAISIPPMDDGMFNQWTGNGSYMVNLFFVLSGFVLAHTYYSTDLSKGNNLKQFFIKRAKRLLPIYYLSVLLALAFIFYVGVQTSTYQTVLVFVGLQAFDFTAFTAVNPPSWSLSVEFVLYLFFPLILRFSKGVSKSRFSLVAVVFWVVAECVLVLLKKQFPDWNFTFFPLLSIPSFMVGIAVYNYFQEVNRWRKKQKLVAFWVVTTTVMVLLYQIWFYKNFSGQLAILFGLMVLFLASIKQDDKMTQPWFLKILGDISFPIYLLHWPLHQIYGGGLELLGVHNQNTLILFALYLSVVIFCSWAVVVLQEKMFNLFAKQTLSNEK